MEWYWWIVIVFVGGFLAFQVLQWVIGRSINVTDAGRVYLDMQLKQLGIRHLIPNAAVIEMADKVSSMHWEMAESDGKSKNAAKLEMMPHLLSEARLMTMWVSGDPGLEQFDHLTQTMKKYGVPFGAARKRA